MAASAWHNWQYASCTLTRSMWAEVHASEAWAYFKFPTYCEQRHHMRPEGVRPVEWRIAVLAECLDICKALEPFLPE